MAEHGTEASTPARGFQVDGDRISFIKLDANGSVLSYEVFASGFFTGSNANYDIRPVGILVMTDGSILISDDQSHRIYRIWYEAD